MNKKSDFDYSKVDSIFRKFLSEKKYEVVKSVGDTKRKTFTYQCESEMMPFWVKLGVSDKDENKRIGELKNEVYALERLWGMYPSGETNSFQLPPGPEDVFEEEYDGVSFYGYTRFVVEGKLLSTELKEGREKIATWVDKYVSMIKTIDSLPDLDLPRTKQKKDEKFDEVIMKNAKFWRDQLKELEYGDLGGCIDDVLEGAESYLKENKVVTGSVHGDLVPEHIVFMEGRGKPTIVNFTKLCQWYPRFWDVGAIYGWIVAMLGELGPAEDFWKGITDNGFGKGELEFLKVVRNVATMGMLATATDPKGQAGELKVGCEVFV